MKLVVEISLYPLVEDYIPAIKQFIERLNTYAQFDVETNATSTRVSGDYKDLMVCLTNEMQRTHDEVGQAVFVCKFLNGDAMQKQREMAS